MILYSICSLVFYFKCRMSSCAVDVLIAGDFLDLDVFPLTELSRGWILICSLINDTSNCQRQADEKWWFWCQNHVSVHPGHHDSERTVNTMKLWAVVLKNSEVRTSVFIFKNHFIILFIFVKNHIWDDNERLNYRTLLHSKLNIWNSFGAFLFLCLNWNRIWMQDSILCSEQ